ncbi:MAG: DSD1 family PLP-dependent enzyme [Desulfobacterales bacterium]|jgi:D-serine deaminase-like pyridoxal phosphate-dependent protein
MAKTRDYKYELDTPCLTIDIDILEKNIAIMQAAADAAGKNLRPHAKTHKCSQLAKKQLEAGAIGVCAAKVSEAEVLADAGVQGILITGPVVTAQKIERLATILKKDSTIRVVVDHPENVHRLDDAMRGRRLSLDVLLDTDVGLGRTGVLPESALELRDHITHASSLRLKGVQAYAGFVQHIPSYPERKKASLECMQRAAALFRNLKEKERTCTIFSGAGTGTYDIDIQIPELTELQVGSYAVMDAEYLNIGVKDNPARFVDFQPALTLLTTVVSVNHPEFVTVDAGLKSLYRHGGSPFVTTPGFTDLRYEWFGDEYGKLICKDGGDLPPLGTVLELVTSHCDPTINLFDCFYITRGKKVVDRWPIDLRGKSQ